MMNTHRLPIEDPNDFLETIECTTDQFYQEEPRETYHKQIFDSSLQSLKNEELIISMLQEMKKNEDYHHTVAATREHVTTEAEHGRQHTEEQFQKMKDTILELQKYIDSYSSKRLLTIYSSLMLVGSCALFIVRLFGGPLTIDSPIPELAIIVSIAFLMMARYAPMSKS